jgi:hypothetical protein
VVFNRGAIQAVVNEVSSLQHVVTVLAPYSFELRPIGFGDDEPSYRVLAERTAFRLRATVVPDYLAVAIVAAVVSGSTNNPTRTTHLITDLEGAGWSPDIDLSSSGFRIQATRTDSVAMDEDDLAGSAAQAAVLMSEFVLDQLVITRPLGEMRGAVERAISGEPSADPWLYDPSERDRSTQTHRALENWLIASLKEKGIAPLDPAGEPFFDLAWQVHGALFVCEVKSTINSEVHQLRLGLGQVLQYRQLLEQAGWSRVTAVVLVEREPRAPEWQTILERVGVRLLWPSNWGALSEELTGVQGPRPYG